MKRIKQNLAVIGLAVGLSAPALAIPIAGVNDPANNTAEFTYSVSPFFELTVGVENTSNYDARITGFGFDIRGGTAGALISVSGTLDDGDWGFDFFSDALPGPGSFDAYAITGTNIWGGDPNSGIAVGDTGVFEFVGFFSHYTRIENILVRFQQTGESGEGSDRGVACTQNCEPPVQVPEPGPLSLLGIGLIGIGLVQRRRQRRAS